MNRKTLITLINILIIITVSGLSLYLWIFSLESYDAIERNEINFTSEYFENGITDEGRNILSQVKDYALWDDASSVF